MDKDEETITIQLTRGEIHNLIAFGNRASMTGLEADEWVAVKNNLARQIQPEFDGNDGQA